MNKIIVMGPTGTGKSTLAKQLAAKLNVTYVEGDSLIWLPNWKQRTRDDFKEKVDTALTQPNWVFDGCYSDHVMRDVWPLADTLIWLDYPRPLVLWQVFKRTFTNVITGRETCNGNRETFKTALLNRNSILLYALTSYRQQRKEFAEIYANLPSSLQNRQHFTTPAQTTRWLAELQ